MRNGGFWFTSHMKLGGIQGKLVRDVERREMSANDKLFLDPQGRYRLPEGT